MKVCFQIWYFGTPGPLIVTFVSLEERRYRLEVICGRTTFAEKSFQTFSPNLVLFSRVALRSAKFFRSLLVNFGGVKASFLI